MLQREGLTEEDFHCDSIDRVIGDPSVMLKGCSDVLSLTRPDIVYGIHQAYLEAGADIITTNSFTADAISLADYHLADLSYDINVASAEIARQAASEYELIDGRPRFVAGSVGPTHMTASLSADVDDPAARAVTFDQLAAAYRTQIEGLMDGGADILLFETIFDTLNAKAAVAAAREVFRARDSWMPLMFSATLSDASGRMLAGQSPEAFIIAVDHADPFSIGLNCSLGAGEMLQYLERIAGTIPTLVSVHPNAGLPDQYGRYVQSAQEMVNILREFMRKGLVNIVGGCCGTTPDHIRLIAEAAAAFSPRVVPVREPGQLSLSGLDPLVLSAFPIETDDKDRAASFLHIGERTNVAGSRRFARLIREGSHEEALQVARDQIEAGARIIDICMDDPLLDAQEAMTRFLRLIASEPDIARVPVMVDSSRWEVVEEGLRSLQGKGIVNSISLKEGPEVFLARAKRIRDLGAAMVVMLFDEQGQADTYARKIAVAERSYRLLTKEAGILGEEIIFDPNILAVATGMAEHDRYAADFIEAVRWIKQNLPGARVSGGVSNLSFSFRGVSHIREAMHSVFLYHAIRAGMDMAIVNPEMLMLYDDIEPELLTAVEDVILARGDTAAASERLIDLAGRLREQQGAGTGKKDQPKDAGAWRTAPVKERLEHSLIQGVTQYLEEDLREAREQASAAGAPSLSIIEGPLMSAMGHVGRAFGAGKMFLPQVVKSARVMRRAVDILQPAITEENRGVAVSAGRIVVATVKGDVHDIGKNIVSVILSCNNFEVIDLGVMVEASRIIDTAISMQADMIGLSGLITPSLDEMRHVALEMERRGLRIPLIIGGATTSAAYTAIRIDPMYQGPVLYASDASEGVRIAGDLVSQERRPLLLHAIQQGFETIRARVRDDESLTHPLLVPFAESRERASTRPVLSGGPLPEISGITRFERVPVQSLAPYINWRMVCRTWGVPVDSPDGQTLRRDAEELLAVAAERGLLYGRGVVGLFPAASLGDDIRVFPECAPPVDLHFLREQTTDAQGVYQGRSLADLVAPLGEDGTAQDVMGLFIATTGSSAQEFIDSYRTGETQDEYHALLVQTLTDRLAEAFSEYLHAVVRRSLWGYAKDEQLAAERLYAGGYQGIRPAVGYPACPDHTEKQLLFDLLDGTSTTGVSLTSSYAMTPAASVCGYYFSTPDAGYPSVRKIGEDQLEAYAQRKGWSREEAERWLSTLL